MVIGKGLQRGRRLGFGRNSETESTQQWGLSSDATDSAWEKWQIRNMCRQAIKGIGLKGASTQFSVCAGLTLNHTANVDQLMLRLTQKYVLGKVSGEYSLNVHLDWQRVSGN